MYLFGTHEIFGISCLAPRAFHRAGAAYIALVERERGDGLRRLGDGDAFHQASVAGVGGRGSGRGGRRSQYDVLVYDALERAHVHHVHDARYK